MKRCTSCGGEFADSEFYKRSGGGRAAICKACDNARRAVNSRVRRERITKFVDRAVSVIPEWLPSLSSKQQRQARELISLVSEDITNA